MRSITELLRWPDSSADPPISTTAHAGASGPQAGAADAAIAAPAMLPPIDPPPTAMPRAAVRTTCSLWVTV
jgi:hypothetical protein